MAVLGDQPVSRPLDRVQRPGDVAHLHDHVADVEQAQPVGGRQAQFRMVVAGQQDAHVADRRRAEPRARPEDGAAVEGQARSEEHTSELQSLMRYSYAGFWWNKTTQQ